MKKNLIVLQDGYKECGAASLLSIIHYYKGSISMARLVELTNMDLCQLFRHIFSNNII